MGAEAIISYIYSMQTATEIINSSEELQKINRRFNADPVIQSFNSKISEMKMLAPRRIIAYENGPIIEDIIDESFVKAIKQLEEIRSNYILREYPDIRVTTESA